MNKMRSFWDSSFYDDKGMIASRKMLHYEASLEQSRQESIVKDNIRKAFLEQRILELGPMGYGFRSLALVQHPRCYRYDYVLQLHDYGMNPHTHTHMHTNIYPSGHVYRCHVCFNYYMFQYYYCYIII